MRTCQWEEEPCDKLCEGSTDFCGTHNRLRRKQETDDFKALQKAQTKTKPISKASDKQAARLKIYAIDRVKFLEGKRCAVFPHLKATQVHHMKGRIGELLLDQRYWLPVSDSGHKEIELNPEWAKAEGFSLSRLES